MQQYMKICKTDSYSMPKICVIMQWPGHWPHWHDYAFLALYAKIRTTMHNFAKYASFWCLPGFSWNLNAKCARICTTTLLMIPQRQSIMISTFSPANKILIPRILKREQLKRWLERQWSLLCTLLPLKDQLESWKSKSQHFVKLVCSLSSTL